MLATTIAYGLEPGTTPTAAWMTGTSQGVVGVLEQGRPTWQERHVGAEALRQTRTAGVPAALFDRVVEFALARSRQVRARTSQNSLPPGSAFCITLGPMKETISGVPVTEEQIQAWADEAERGYDVEHLRRRGRKPMGDGPAKVVPVRLDDTTIAAVDERARRDHVTRSEAIRAAIRAYVA